jgi:hypothetical protein
MMSEDKKCAKQMVNDEICRLAKELKEMSRDMPVEAIAYGNDGSASADWPEMGDGDRVLIHVTIGERGNLTKGEARLAASMWHAAIKRYPKGIFVLNLLGYNEDPREIWDIAEAARYVRWWARFADMNEIENAAGFLGLPGTSLDGVGVAFLAACGVFGDEAKRAALAKHKPMTAH